MDDTLLRDAANPRLSELIREYTHCGAADSSYDATTDSEKVRFARWADQAADCKKHSRGDFRAKPWDGASDQRVFLADEIIQDEVAILISAFDRVAVQAEALSGGAFGTAGSAARMLKWFTRSRALRQLKRDVELSAQYMATYGWCVLNPVWERRVALRNQTIKLEEVQALIGPERSQALLDPAFEDEAANMLVELRQAWVNAHMAGIMDPDEIPSIGMAKARSYVRALREDGQVTVPMPYVCRNQPRIRSLRPWEEIRLPEQQGDLQEGMAFVTEYLTEDQVLANVVGEGWDRAWAEEAIKTKGQRTVWSRAEKVTTPSGIAERIDRTESRLIEVVTAYTSRLDKDGIPGIYVTIFSPHVRWEKDEDRVAKHGLLDYQHGLMPLVEGAREWWCRDITAARGVPEQVYPAQRLMKVTEDALIDRSSLTTLPPRLVPPDFMDHEDVFGPAARVPTRPGREPRFMDIPANDGVAERIWLSARAGVNRQMGRPDEGVPPLIAQVRTQKLVNEFLAMWTEAFQQTWALMMQYSTDAEWQRILGMPKPQLTPDQIASEGDIMLVLDARELDSEFALKQLEGISKFVLPEDAAGVVDRGELIRLKLSALHPGLARQLVQDKAGATQKLFERVSAEFASMALGNPPRLVENDPTAPMQIQFAQQIVQANPRYQTALQSDPLFKQNVETWLKNREQSAVQQQNKVVGRLGVQPQ